jgi:creatinine amidohydrolase
LRQLTGKVIAVIDWFAYIKDGYRHMESKYMWHADESETSLMLYMHPELVRMDLAVNEAPRAIPLFEFTHEALLSAKVDMGLPRTKAVVDSGTFGDAQLGTAAKGKICVDEAVEGLVKVLRDLRTHGSEIASRYRPD